MAQPVQNSHGNLIRSNAGNNGDTTFVDYDNLHPTNEAAAAMSGALSGGLLGGTAAVLGSAVVGIGKEGEAVAEQLAANAKKGTKGISLLATTVLIAVPAAIGAITNVLRARTHNQWSNRVLSSIEKQKQAIDEPAQR